MCRKDGEPGGPRRCGKHMAQRLSAARAAFQSANHALTERQVLLDGRKVWHEATLAGYPMDRGAERQARSQVRRAEDGVVAATQKKVLALDALRRAQADYDSTREGLQDLRDEFDDNPNDPTVRDRLLLAVRTYEHEASLREVEFGPQGPLSRKHTDQHGPVGRVLSLLGASGWLKSAPREDARTGLHEHRVNIVWQDGPRRRSLTVPLLSTDPGRRLEGEVDIEGQPTLGQVGDRIALDAEGVAQADGSYAQWVENRGSRNSLSERQQWRAANKAAQVVDRLLEAQT